MKTHKILIALAAVVILTSQSAMADRFVAVVTGVKTQGSKSAVKYSLEQLPGVQSVRFATFKSSDSHKVTVVTDGSQAISQADAQATLSTYGGIYKIKEWNWFAK